VPPFAGLTPNSAEIESFEDKEQGPLFGRVHRWGVVVGLATLLVAGFGLVFFVVGGKKKSYSDRGAGQQVAANGPLDSAMRHDGAPNEPGMQTEDAEAAPGAMATSAELQQRMDAGSAKARNVANEVVYGPVVDVDRSMPPAGRTGARAASGRPAARVSLLKASRSSAAAGQGRAHARPAARKGDVRAVVTEARSALLAGRYGLARRLIRRLSAMPGMGGRALALQAEMAFQQSQYKSAARLASRAIHSGGGTKARLTLANAYYRLGLHKSAAAAYKDVLRRWPHSRAARVGLRAAMRHLK